MLWRAFPPRRGGRGPIKIYHRPPPVPTPVSGEQGRPGPGLCSGIHIKRTELRGRAAGGFRYLRPRETLETLPRSGAIATPVIGNRAMGRRHRAGRAHLYNFAYFCATSRGQWVDQYLGSGCRPNDEPAQVERHWARQRKHQCALVVVVSVVPFLMRQPNSGPRSCACRPRPTCGGRLPLIARRSV